MTSVLAHSWTGTIGTTSVGYDEDFERDLRDVNERVSDEQIAYAEQKRKAKAKFREELYWFIQAQGQGGLSIEEMHDESDDEFESIAMVQFRGKRTVH